MTTSHPSANLLRAIAVAEAMLKPLREYVARAKGEKE